jgi:hypothetical protein
MYISTFGLLQLMHKGSVTRADIRADIRWWSGGHPQADHYDQKEISLGLLVVQRISARMSASLT